MSKKRGRKKKVRPNPFASIPSYGTIAVYYRVSTEDQTLDSQSNAVARWLDDNPQFDREKVREYYDIGLSGNASNRPGFNAMIDHTERGRVRAVICYKLDRLTRNAITGIRTLLRFDEIGVEFVSVTQPMFSHGTPFRHAIIAIFAELAQMEREQIVERVNAGIAAAKRRGVTFGRPTVIDEDKAARIAELRAAGMSLKNVGIELGISTGAVHKWVRENLEPSQESNQPQTS